MDEVNILKKYIAEMESLPCNLCGKNETQIICGKERFGLDINTVVCKNCGLIYLNPRPAKGQYEEMNRADYRIAVDGTDAGNNKLFQNQYNYFFKNAALLCRKNIGFQPQSILDVGCSCGGALKCLGEIYPSAKLYGLEPIVKHAEYTKEKTGAEVYTGILENWNPGKKFDVILFSKALNHTLDPRGNLEKIKSLLSERGVLILIIHDPMNPLLAYPIEYVSEILHPFMFYRESIKYFLDQVGFNIINYRDGRYVSPSGREMRKLKFPKMIIFARSGRIGSNKTVKPNYLETLKMIADNSSIRLKYGHIYHRWQSPNLAMRFYRKGLK